MAQADTEQQLFPVDQFCQREPAFKQGGIRWLIFNGKTNGLEESGAIVRVGRRVYLHRPKFLAWIEAQQGQQRPRRAA